MHPSPLSPTAPSRSTLLWFLAVVFLWSLAFGGIEYLLKNFSLGPLQAESERLLLEEIVGFMSIGSVTAYALGGAVSSIAAKRVVILTAGVLSIFILLLEHISGWSSPMLLAVSSILLGFFYGLFAVVRSVMVSIEILKTKVKETIINGFTNVSFTAGIIISIYLITRTYELHDMLSFWMVTGFITLSCVLAVPLRYEEYEPHAKPLQALKKFWRETLWVVRRMYMVILPSASIWGIATVVGVWSLPYAESVHGIPESVGSVILLFSAVGVIIGNLLTMRMRHRWLWFQVITSCFGVLVAGFELLTVTFPLMVAYATLLGIAMGAATNLTDSYYLRFVGEQNVKENGAALLGLATNGMVALLLFVLHPLPLTAQALLLGLLALSMGILVRFTLKNMGENATEQ